MHAELDVTLGAVRADQIGLRWSALRGVRPVRINHHARPLYLHGRTGTVAGFCGQSVIVRLDQPVGRFVTGELRCPPLALDRLGPE
jgi:hypothetical protein